MKTIIRIEHPEDGLGIWRSGGYAEVRVKKLGCFNELHKRHTYLNGYPGPQNDPKLHDLDYENYYFGFNSIEQFNNAFLPEEVKEIVNFGFQVLTLEVTEYIESDYQTIFKKESIVSMKDISSLFV